MMKNMAKRLSAKKHTLKLDDDIKVQLDSGIYPSGMLAMVGAHLATLTKDESSYVLPARKNDAHARIDCIVVPTNRNIGKGQHIRSILRLVREHQTPNVLFLCSGAAKKEELTRIASEFTDISWIIVEGPFPHEHNNFRTTQSLIAYGGEKDLAQKRNFALQLAKLLGWRYVFFMDDDVDVSSQELVRVADLLKSGASVVGFSIKSFPDHSVVVHASRWVHAPIDSFIGGGVLGVNIDASYLPFFPHVYNEDWLFLLLHCLLDDDGLVWAGTLTQRKYNPFKNPERVKSEEPGDLLAESLMRLAISMKTDQRLPRTFNDILSAIHVAADEAFWQQEINERIAFIRTTADRVRSQRLPSRKRRQILRSLAYSLAILTGNRSTRGLRSDELAAWVRDWIEDLRSWNTTLTDLPRLTNIGVAMEYLEMQNSFTVQYVAPMRQAKPEAIQSVAGVPSELKSLPPIARKAGRIRGLYSTKLLQDFLAAKGLTMQALAESNERLRFDRPTVNYTVPVLTVAMLVTEGESLRLVSDSIRDIRQSVDTKVPLQIVVWVYGLGGHRRQSEVYRNKLITRLVPEVRGTNVLLRSGILSSSNANVDQQIDEMVVTIALAYWLSEIEGDHPVYVVNSRNELLRKGTLWEFLRQEHTVSSRPLRTYLEEVDTIPPPTSRAQVSLIREDEHSIDMSRVRLVSRTSSKKRYAKIFSLFSPVVKLGLSMRRAKLTWVELDDITHGLVFDDTIKRSPNKIVCVPVAFERGLNSDMRLVARRVIEFVGSSRRRNASVECIVVVYGTSADSWKQLQSFRKALMSLIKTEGNSSDVVFGSLVCHCQYATSAKRARVIGAVVTRYRHWLETYELKGLSRRV